MKYDEVHFENAKGHALASLKTAEKALLDDDLQIAKIALKEARSSLVTMRNETLREGATEEATAEYKELDARFNNAANWAETSEKAEEDMALALDRFEAQCKHLESLMDDYAELIAWGKSESAKREEAIENQYRRRYEDYKSLVSADSKYSVPLWERLEKIEARFNTLKHLGRIANEYYKLMKAQIPH